MPRKYSLRPNGEDMGRLTVYVPRTSIAELKRHAKRKRVSLSQVATEAIDRHLERPRKVAAS